MTVHPISRSDPALRYLGDRVCDERWDRCDDIDVLGGTLIYIDEYGFESGEAFLEHVALVAVTPPTAE